MRNNPVKALGAKPFVLGLVLTLISFWLMTEAPDSHVRRLGLMIGIGGVAALLIGMGQYLSYHLRSEKGKQEYRQKWAKRGLYHSLVMTAVADNELSKKDNEYIKKIYRNTFYEELTDKEILKLAKHINEVPEVYIKDIKLYENRIDDVSKEHIIKACVELAANHEELEGMYETLHQISTSLKVNSKLVGIEINKRKRAIF